MSYHINRYYVVRLQEEPPKFLAISGPTDKGPVVASDSWDAHPHFTQQDAEDALERCRNLVADLGVLEAFDDCGPEVMAVHRLRIVLSPEALEAAFTSDEEVLRGLQAELPSWIDAEKATREGVQRNQIAAHAEGDR